MNYLTEEGFTCPANLPAHDEITLGSFYAACNGCWHATVTDKGQTSPVFHRSHKTSVSGEEGSEG